MLLSIEHAPALRFPQRGESLPEQLLRKSGDTFAAPT
jgi:hypothetical protein